MSNKNYCEEAKVLLWKISVMQILIANADERALAILVSEYFETKKRIVAFEYEWMTNIRGEIPPEYSLFHKASKDFIKHNPRMLKIAERYSIDI